MSVPEATCDFALKCQRGASLRRMREGAQFPISVSTPSYASYSLASHCWGLKSLLCTIISMKDALIKSFGTQTKEQSITMAVWPPTSMQIHFSHCAYETRVNYLPCRLPGTILMAVDCEMRSVIICGDVLTLSTEL